MQITNLAASLSFKVAGSVVLSLPFPLPDQALTPPLWAIARALEVTLSLVLAPQEY